MTATSGLCCGHVRNGLWGHAAYNTAKGGVYAIVSGLRREFAKNLEQRALRLLKREAHVEYPHSNTLHNVTNVRIVNNEEDAVKVRCNFSTFGTKREILDNYVGVNEYIIVKEHGELKIQSKKVILKLDSLRPHGKVSSIL